MVEELVKLNLKEIRIRIGEQNREQERGWILSRILLFIIVVKRKLASLLTRSDLIFTI